MMVSNRTVERTARRNGESAGVLLCKSMLLNCELENGMKLKELNIYINFLSSDDFVQKVKIDSGWELHSVLYYF